RNVAWKASSMSAGSVSTCPHAARTNRPCRRTRTAKASSSRVRVNRPSSSRSDSPVRSPRAQVARRCCTIRVSFGLATATSAVAGGNSTGICADGLRAARQFLARGKAAKRLSLVRQVLVLAPLLFQAFDKVRMYGRVQLRQERLVEVVDSDQEN